MGVRTSFFTASREQLLVAAPGWVVPEYGAFTEQEDANPFTKKGSVRVKRFELLSEHPQHCPPDRLVEIIPPHRRFAWRLLGPELEELMQLLTEATEDEVGTLGRLALLGPPDAEHWVFELPEALVRALAALCPARVPVVAEEWRESLGWDAAPTPILEELVEVAGEAVRDGRRMFSYVSL